MIAEILTWLSTPVATGAIVWFFQERYKNKLNKENTKFNKLHERRAEIIAKLYSYFIELRDATSMYIHATEQRAEMQSRFDEKARELRSFYLQNEIYFSDETSKKVEELLNMLIDPVGVYMFWEKQGNEETRNINRSHTYMIDAFYDEVPQLLQSIKNEFREILGAK